MTKQLIQPKRSQGLKFNIHRLQPLFDVRPEPSIIGEKKRAYFIDLSHWVDRWVFADALPGLIDGAYQKVTQGTWLVDSRLDAHYASGVSHVAVPGGYHYWETKSKGIDQADFFLSHCEGKNYKVLAGDIESYANTFTHNSIIEFYNFMDYLTIQRPDVKVILYSNPNIYDSVIFPMSMAIWGRDPFLRWPFWCAQYPYVVNPDGTPYTGKRRLDWDAGWQFSAAGNPADHGATDWVDRNVFNGTLPEYLDWAGGASVPPPDNGGPMPTTHYGRVKQFTNIRSTPPGGAYQDIGDLFEGDEVEATEIRLSGTNQIPWWKLSKWTRNGQAMTLPGPEAWAYGINITELPAPDPDPDPEPPVGGFPAEMNMTLDYPTADGGQVVYKGIVKKQ